MGSTLQAGLPGTRVEIDHLAAALMGLPVQLAGKASKAARL